MHHIYNLSFRIRRKGGELMYPNNPCYKRLNHKGTKSLHKGDKVKKVTFQISWCTLCGSFASFVVFKIEYIKQPQSYLRDARYPQIYAA